MPRDALTLFSYEILGLVGRNGAAPHDMVRFVRRDRMFAWSGERRYYIEPQRLTDLGYLQRRTEPGHTHARSVYRLTPKALEALRDYARTPVRFTPLKSEALIRLLITDLVGEAATLQGIRDLREDIADLEDRLDDIQTRTLALPHRRKYVLLVIAFMRRLFALHLQLVDELEREFDPRDHGPFDSDDHAAP
jgi:DNA-binding PadR family transcriptional regulator